MMDDMHDRRLNTVIFRTFIEAQGTELPLVLVLDDTLYSTIRVLVAPKVLKNGNETAVYNQPSGPLKRERVVGKTALFCCRNGKS